MDSSREGKTGSQILHRIVSWSLIAILLTLRIPFLGLFRLFSDAAWPITVWNVGTYFLTAVFLWWECKDLKAFHVDMLALWIIVLFKPVETLILKLWGTDNALAFPKPASLLIWGIAICLAIALWFCRRDLPRFEWRGLGWFALGTLIGVGTALVLAVPMALQLDFGIPPSEFWLTLKQMGASSFLYQIGFAAVAEEPLFRGFLWGALRKTGWKELWIWLLQACPFMLAHIYYFGVHPIWFFVLVPVGALVLGLVAWKSRTISATLPLHGAMNALGLLLGRLAAYYLK